MKRLLILFFVLLLSLLHASAVSDEIVIILQDDSQNVTKIRPRSVSIVPVRCVYSSASGSLVFSFYDNLGMVAIKVHNMSSSEIYYAYLDSTDVVSSVEFCGTKGNYLIRIETQDGDVYTGEFTVE